MNAYLLITSECQTGCLFDTVETVFCTSAQCMFHG